MNKTLKVTIFSCASFFSTIAYSHEWYPIECCSKMHCDVAQKVEFKDEGWVITTKVGTAFFPKTFQIRASQDENIHACMISALMKRNPCDLFVSFFQDNHKWI